MKQEELAEQKKFFENEQKTNSLLEKFIDQTEKRLVTLRTKQQSSNEIAQSFENDVNFNSFNTVKTCFAFIL